MLSSLEYEYSVTRGATKEAWNSQYVRWSLGGAITSNVGGKGRWLVGWLCGTGFFVCKNVNGVELGSHDGILLGR